ncbi:putative mynd domain [Diplodia seriata]|uniref:Putative mynd domain n=1 Tax=Diplodia seriata TaxID=420778 RepID=A0A0G2EUN5_9PEZI|nr:putative mynd domain [Diplodia seriata]
MGNNSNDNQPTCSSCGKPSQNLKRCAKCHSEQYCNRDCQKAHWKTHKKVCAAAAAAAAEGATTSNNNNNNNNNNDDDDDDDDYETDDDDDYETAGAPLPKNLDTPIPDPFTRLTTRTWLHDRSERDTYRLLIDAYRLRMSDQYTFEGDADVDCVLGGAVASSIGGFTRFLRKLGREAPDLLPPWWSAAKEEECRRAGMAKRY